jgi:hypothetical protein
MTYTLQEEEEEEEEEEEGDDEEEICSMNYEFCSKN